MPSTAREPFGSSGWDLLMPFIAFVMLVIALEQKWTPDQRRSHKLGKRARR